MAMASGGYVPRYAAGTSNYGALLAREMNTPPPAPRPPAQAPPSLAMSSEDIAKRYPDKPLAGYIDELRSAYGPRDYSAEKKLVDYQTQMAESKKPRFGDALIAAGAAMASNRDNKVGLANLLAQAAGVGSQSYDAAKENQNKLRNLAMMGQVALQRQQQKDSDDIIGKAMESKRSDVGVNLGKLQTIEANIRSISEALSRAQSDTDKMMLQRELNRFEAIKSMAVAEANNAADIQRALIASSMRNQQKPSDKDIKNSRGLALAQSAMMYAVDYLQKNPKIKSDQPTLALSNLQNPAFFKDYDPEDRMRAGQFIRDLVSQNLRDEKSQVGINKEKNKADPFGGLGTQITSGQQEESFTGDFNGRRIN